MDSRIEYRHPTARDLTTIYATLRKEGTYVKASDGTLVTGTASNWSQLAHPLSDAALPYLYVATPHANTPAGVYTLEIYVSASVGVRDVNDDLIAGGSLNLRIAAATLGAGTTSIKEAVQIELGSNGIDVELVDSDYLTCLTAALRELNRVRPPRSWGVLNYVTGTAGYALNHPGIIGVTDVQFVANDAGLIGDEANDCAPMMVITPFGGVTNEDTIGALVTPTPGDTPAETALIRGFASDVRRVYGRSTDYTTRRVNGTLYLYVDNPTNAKIAYEYTWAITPDDHATTGVGQIRPGDLQWVIDFTKARAKQVLARIIGKHGGINLPGGGVESLDADALRSEGREDEERLKEELKSRRRPVLPEKG